MPGIPQGFNAGFAQGLARVLGSHRDNENIKAREAEDRKGRTQQAILAEMLGRADDPNDAIAAVEELYPGLFKNKNGDVSRTILSRALPQAAMQALGGAGGGVGGPQAAQQGGWTDPRTSVAQAPPQERPQPAPGGAPPVGLLGGAPPPLAGPVPGGAPPVGAVGSPAAAAPPQAPPQIPPGTILPVGATPASVTQPLNPLSKSAGVIRAGELQMQVRQNVVDRLKTIGMPLDEQETQYYLTNGQLARPYGSTSAGMPRSVPGETPDGKAAYAIFDPIARTYTDQNGNVIEGFRPRTSTGSRTLGGDRESVSVELYGVPASQLDGPKMAHVNQVVRERAIENAKNKGLATGEAQNTTKLHAPIDVPNLPAVGGIAGTSLADVEGQSVMTKDQVEARQAIRTLDIKLPELTALITKVIPDYGEGLVARARTSGELHYKRLAGDPEYTQLRGLALSMAGEVAKVIQNQPGVLSNLDTNNARAILTDVDAWLADTQQSALAKQEMLARMSAAISQAIPNPQSTRQPGARPAAPATPTPAPKPSAAVKPPVSNAAPTAQKVGGAWVIP